MHNSHIIFDSEDIYGYLYEFHISIHIAEFVVSDVPRMNFEISFSPTVLNLHRGYKIERIRYWDKRRFNGSKAGSVFGEGLFLLVYTF